MCEKVREKTYILTHEVSSQTGAHSALLQLGATVVMASKSETLSPTFFDKDLYVVLADPEGSGHRFPSKCLRVLSSLEKARGQKFFVPALYDDFLKGRHVTVIVVRVGSDVPRLRTALRNFHLRDTRTGAWFGPKRKRSSRRTRQEERRRERREQYALP